MRRVHKLVSVPSPDSTCGWHWSQTLTSLSPFRKKGTKALNPKRSLSLSHSRTQSPVATTLNPNSPQSQSRGSSRSAARSLRAHLYKLSFFDAHTRLNQARSVEPLELDSLTGTPYTVLALPVGKWMFKHNLVCL